FDEGDARGVVGIAGRERQEKVKMIGKENNGVDNERASLPAGIEGIVKKLASRFGDKNWSAVFGDDREEERAARLKGATVAGHEGNGSGRAKCGARDDCVNP
ncbi:MAG TPA: hypothetical protein VIL86_15735, partial [Tepidisphaeraceae bacterium]